MLLGDSSYAGTATYDSARELAAGAAATNDGQADGLVELIDLAQGNAWYEVGPVED